MTDKEREMRYKIKYKDLINRFKPYTNNEVVMVASKEEVSFYDQDGMKRITHLVEYENKEGCSRTLEDNS